jgi:hypothetical protein
MPSELKCAKENTMNRSLKKQTLAMICAAAAIAVAVVVAPARKNVASPPRISFVVKGKLMTQAAAGGAVRAATATEKNKWRKSPMVSAISPDGKLEVKQIFLPDTEGSDSPYVTFEVIQRSNGKVIFHPRQIAHRIPDAIGGDLRTGIRFDYWLPDSKHIAFAAIDGDSSGSSYYHYVMNVYTGNLLPFTGWLAPNGKTAIVPENEYDSRDSISYGHDNGPGYVSVISDEKWYVVPLPKGFTSYRFKTASKKLIEGPRALVVEPDLKNKWGMRRVIKSSYTWFPLTTYMFSDFVESRGDMKPPAKIVHQPIAEFSKDSQWAIGNGNLGAFLISMATGKARKLPGIQAHFVN